MLKALLSYLGSHLQFNSSSVKKAVEKAIAQKILDAEARANEDIQFHQKEFNDAVAAALTKFLEDKESAVKRQVNQILTSLAA